MFILSVIWIDAFDGTPENKQVRDFFTFLKWNKEWIALAFAEDGVARFMRRHGGAMPPPPLMMMLKLWAKQQADQGKVEISSTENEGFKVKLMPKGGFLMEQATGGNSITSFSMFG